MSYSRWGTPLSLDFQQAAGETDPITASIAWYTMDQDNKSAELQRQDAVAFQWYIYWHVASEQTLGRNGQL